MTKLIIKMASTPKGAQNVLVCEFCEIETKIIGKCLDCSLLLCTKCSKKLHSKLKQALDHRIVKLKDLSEQHEQEPKTNRKATTCQIHQSQVYCLYCKSCEVLACPSCIPSSHQSHNLGEIESTIKERIEDIENLKTELEMSLSQKKGNLKETRRIKELNFNEVKDRIKKEEDRLIFHIKSKTRSDLDTLEKNWRLDDKLLSEEETSLDVKLAELLDSSKSIQSEIENGEIVNVVSLINATKTLQNTLRLNDNCLDSDVQLFDFIPGNVDFAKTPKLLGSFISCRKTKSFELPFDPYCMALTNNGNIWITDGVQIVECNPREEMEIVRRTECDCQEIRCSNSSEIFVLTGHEVMKIHASGRLNRIHNFAPYETTTFHMSEGNELTVIMQSNKKNQSKIVILTIDGNMKQEYNFSELVIIDCNSIVKTSDGLFCLSSQKTLDNILRTVKMINTNGQIIWEYPLNSSMRVTNDNFRPSEITESRECNIIMTELTSSALHISNKAGQILKIVSTLQFGIQNPGLIASDCNGNLWINGECYKRGNPVLCILEITGF